MTDGNFPMAHCYPVTQSDLREALDGIQAQCDEMRSLKGWRLNLIRENLAKAYAAIPAHAQAAWKPDLQAARNAVRDEIGSRLCHLTPHGTRICTRQVSSTCLCEETARAALCSQAPSPSMSSTQCGGSDEVQK